MVDRDAARDQRERFRGPRQLRGVVERHNHSASADTRLELIGCSLGDDAAVVDDDDVIGEPVGLVQILGREYERRALRDEFAEHRPEVAAAVRVESGGGLVEEEDGRRGDQAGGEVESPAHAARVGLDGLACRVGEVERGEQLGGPGARDPAREVVEAADHLQVGASGQQLVHRRLLAGEADAWTHARRLADDVEAVNEGASLVRPQQRRQDANGGRLAGAVAAEQAQHATPGDLEVDLAQRPVWPEAFAEALGTDGVIDRAHSLLLLSYGVLAPYYVRYWYAVPDVKSTFDLDARAPAGGTDAT